MSKPIIFTNETDQTVYITYDGTFHVTNAAQSPLSAKLHDVPVPWLYRGGNLELVAVVTSAAICIAALALLLAAI